MARKKNAKSKSRNEQQKQRRKQEKVKENRRRSIAPLTEGQQAYIRAIQSSDITFGVGPAGTGKTFLASTLAVNALLDGEVEKIVLVRPAVEAGEKLGYLPGTLEEKVDPYMRPIYDAMEKILTPQKIKRYLETGTIEIAPLAFMRGRTLTKAFCILDEGQNTTATQMKMFLTRIGRKSKAVITGDVSQTDLLGQKSGLADAIARLSEVKGIEICNLSTKDVVRHKLVQDIIDAYEKEDA